MGTVSPNSILILTMATIEGLKKVLLETLESKGVVNEVQSHLRAEVFKALEDPSTEKPKLSNGNLIINELIREYLNFNNYKYAESGLVAESGQPNGRLDRNFICNELNVKESDSSYSVPLLYSLVKAFSEKKD